MENEFNEATQELAPKPKRRTRRSKKPAELSAVVTETPDVHYAALYESLEENKVEEPVVEPEPTPEPVVTPVRPRRQQLIRPMKKKQPPASRPGRRQRKAI